MPIDSNIMMPSTGNTYCSAIATLPATSVRRPSQIGSTSNGWPTGQAWKVSPTMRSASWCRSSCRISRKPSTCSSCETTVASVPLSGFIVRAIEKPISELTISPAETSIDVNVDIAKPSAKPITPSRIAITPSASRLPGTSTCWSPTHQKIDAKAIASTSREMYESTCWPKNGTTVMKLPTRTRCRNSAVT